MEEEVTVALVAGVVDMWSTGNASTGQLGLSREDAFVSVSVPRLAVQAKGIQTVACGCILKSQRILFYSLGSDLRHRCGTAAEVCVCVLATS